MNNFGTTIRTKPGLRIHHDPGWRLKVVQQSVKELKQFLKTQEEELARFYHIPIPKQTDLPISYNIAPSQKILTIDPRSQGRENFTTESLSLSFAERKVS
jgi:hypothetical protein